MRTVGIDIGGTNRDSVLLTNNGIESYSKVPSKPNDVKGLLKGLQKMREDGAKLGNIDRVVVGTTIILNAAVEGKMKDCASITIPGPGLNSKLAEFGDFNISVGGYVDHRGRKVEDLDTEAIENFRAGIQSLRTRQLPLSMETLFRKEM